jgi:hypothetical protein
MVVFGVILGDQPVVGSLFPMLHDGFLKKEIANVLFIRENAHDLLWFQGLPVPNGIVSLFSHLTIWPQEAPAR